MKEDPTLRKFKGKIDELLDFTILDFRPAIYGKNKRVERIVDPNILSIAYYINDDKEIVSIEIDGLMQLLEEGEE